jgi:hypothetical protein
VHPPHCSANSTVTRSSARTLLPRYATSGPDSAASAVGIRLASKRPPQVCSKRGHESTNAGCSCGQLARADSDVGRRGAGCSSAGLIRRLVRSQICERLGKMGLHPTLSQRSGSSHVWRACVFGERPAPKLSSGYRTLAAPVANRQSGRRGHWMVSTQLAAFIAPNITRTCFRHDVRLMPGCS